MIPKQEEEKRIDIADVVRWWDSATVAQRRAFESYVRTKAMLDEPSKRYANSNIRNDGD